MTATVKQFINLVFFFHYNKDKLSELLIKQINKEIDVEYFRRLEKLYDSIDQVLDEEELSDIAYRHYRISKDIWDSLKYNSPYKLEAVYHNIEDLYLLSFENSKDLDPYIDWLNKNKEIDRINRSRLGISIDNKPLDLSEEVINAIKKLIIKTYE